MEDRSTQSNSELEIQGAVKRPPRECKQSVCRFQQDAYIQIPLSVMSGNESTSDENQLISNDDESSSSLVEGQNVTFNYKLIEGFPSRAEIRIRKSYVMSYNTETKNAEWVYEILNKSTLDKKCKENISFGKNELENKDDEQGHLAAAANHTWCQEAYHDTYLMSNMIPQLSALNKTKWKTLENRCRKLVKPDCNVHVYTGPLYLKKEKDDYVRVPSPKNPNNSEEKAEPTHVFKVIIVEKNGRFCRQIYNYDYVFLSSQNELLELNSTDKQPANVQHTQNLQYCIKIISCGSILMFFEE
uniref:Uncharacterized protein n=1 Tax=Sinocyclocheilus rhinocerous TaxID=307959 RepID=A0A673IYI1_9TELE